MSGEYERHSQGNNTTPETADCQVADIVVLVDGSNSIQPSEIPLVQNFLEGMVNTVVFSDIEAESTQMALMTFNTDVTRIQPMTTLQIRLLESIDNFPQTTGGQTDITNALRTAQQEFMQWGRAGTQKVILLITDGIDSSNPVVVADNLKDSNILIVTVGIGNQENTVIQSLASPGLASNVSDFDALASRVSEITQTTACASDVAGQFPVLMPTTQITPVITLSPDPFPTEEPPLTGSTTNEEILPFLSFLPADYRVPGLMGIAMVSTLLLLAFASWLRRLFGRRSNTTYRNPGSAPPLIPGKKPTLSFIEGLKQETYPTPPAKYADIHEPAMVIGIGETGGAVLDYIVERIKDTNLEKELSDSSQLILLHLTMSNIHASEASNDRYTPPFYKHIDVTGSHRFPDSPGSSSDNERWSWAQIAGVFNKTTIGRHSARVALINDLQFGRKNSELFTLLARYLNTGIKTAFLVGASQDYVGANIMGDIAALMRCAKPDATLNIHTLVAHEENHINSLLDTEVHGYQSATIYELGRMSTPGRIRMRYGPEFIYTGSPRDPLLDSFNLLKGKNKEGVQNITNMLWGMLTHEDFNREVNQLLTPDDLRGEETPSLTVSYTHALQWPVRILREQIAGELMKDFIGGNDLSPHITPLQPPAACTEPEIQVLLDEVREEGLLPSIIALQGSGSCHTRHDATYMDDLHRLFNARRRYYLGQRNTLKVYQDARTNEVLSFPSLKNFRRNTGQIYQDESMDNARRRAGWVAHNNQSEIDRGHLIQLAVPTDDERQAIHRVFATEDKLMRYQEEIEEVVRRIVDNNDLNPLIEEFYSSLNETVTGSHIETLKHAWNKRYKSWNEDTRTIFEGGGDEHRLKIETINIGVPETWNSETQSASFRPGDRTMAMQSRIISRAPIKNLKLLGERRYANIRQYLIFTEENITLDVFDWNINILREMPVSLQAILTYQQAMWDLYRIWMIGGVYAFKTHLKLSLYEDADGNPNHRDLTLAFIDKYEDEDLFRKRVQAYLQEHEGKLANSSTQHFIPDDSLFSEYLMKVFERFTHHIKDITHYPPETSTDA